jgi:hypothetical protein
MPGFTIQKAHKYSDRRTRQHGGPKLVFPSSLYKLITLIYYYKPKYVTEIPGAVLSYPIYSLQLQTGCYWHMHHPPSAETEDRTTSRIHIFLTCSFTCGTILQQRFSTFSVPLLVELFYSRGSQPFLFLYLWNYFTAQVLNLFCSFTCGTILQQRFSTFSDPQTSKILRFGSGN